MTLFALTLSPSVRGELTTLVEVTFITFVVASFIAVAAYAFTQVRRGRLITAENEPLPIRMPGNSGWFFAAGVLGLIYLQSFLYAILVLLGITAVLMENGRTAQAQFGLDRIRPLRVMTWGLLVFGAIMLVETPLSEAASRMLDMLGIAHPEQQSVETFRQYNHISAIAVFMFQAVLLSPAIEEFFFRGFLLTFLKNYTSTWLAITLSAGVFAFAHLNLGAALPLWFLGIVLGIAYEHTGSLLVPISIHACFNLATGLSLLITRGNS
jgi:hypothetical protein